MSMITEQVEKLRELSKQDKLGLIPWNGYSEILNQAADTIEQLAAKLQAVNKKTMFSYFDGVADCMRDMNYGDWIPTAERLPECETEVLIYVERKYRIGKDNETIIKKIITTALYEDGTKSEIDSSWTWYDLDFEKWDEENDCGIIPEGWWEYRHYNPDEVYNNLVDDKILAWMPLPEPYRAESEGADADSN